MSRNFTARCANFGNCKLADSRRVLPLRSNRGQVCPECKSPLHGIADDRAASRKKVVAASIAGGVVFLVLAVAVIFMLRSRKQQELAARQAAAAAQAAAVSQPVPLSTANPDDFKNTPVILRFGGSAAMSGLANGLLKAWLESAGGTDFQRFETIKGKEEFVVIKKDGNMARFNIFSVGNEAGFDGLRDGRFDVAMTTVPISDAQVAALSGFGDMRTLEAEWVIGLDAISIISSNQNPMRMIARQQVIDIFTGKITNWKDLGANDAPINVYTRNDDSSTLASFRQLVVGSAGLSPSARKVGDHFEMVKKVADDPNGIGFSSLAFVNATVKALAVSDYQSRPLVPNGLTVGSEDYVFTRRLYFYVNPRSTSPWLKPFLSWASGASGQKVVSGLKFTGLTLEGLSNTQGLEDAVFVSDTPPDYEAAVENAKRLPLNFRFKTGKTDLDSKSQRDLMRIAEAMKTQPNLTGKKLLLFGFADNVGGEAKNVELSGQRANAVAQLLQQLGIGVEIAKGYGSRRPVASNDTPDGREKNRRVELWVTTR